MIKIPLRKLKEFLTYIPDTGLFIWNVSRGKAKKGNIAGVMCKDKGYIRIQVDGILYHGHRLAWYFIHGSIPQGEIDHINGVKTDNRIENLRPVDRTINNQNKAIGCNNTSGCIGVTWDKKSKKWRANIGFRGKLIHLGLFESFEDAKERRKNAERSYEFHHNHGKSPCDRATYSLITGAE